MLDIKFVRENPEIVKENIKKKFQDAKLPLVDEVIELDKANRAAIQEASDLRAARNALSKANGPLFGKLKKAEGAEKDAIQAEIDANMAKGKANDELLAELEVKEGELAEQIRKIMLVIPNIIDPSVPIGESDEFNVEVERFGEPVTPDYEIPYHTQIMECSEVPIRYRSSPSILYIMASISVWDITPSTTLPWIMKGGVQ